jgi:hypothetical protein
VVDLAGRRVRFVGRRDLARGEHRVAWDGADDRGRALPSGVYLVRVRHPAGAVWARVALVR